MATNRDIIFALKMRNEAQQGLNSLRSGFGTSMRDVQQRTAQASQSVRQLGGTAQTASTQARGLQQQLRATANSVAVLDGPLGGVASRFSALSTLIGRTGLMLGGFLLGVTALTRGLGGAVREQEQFERNLLRTQQIIETTGGVAGRTTEQLVESARRLARETLASTESVMRAQQTLLTFRGIRGDIFDEAIEAANDMAAALGGNLEGAIMQVAKALENPVQGLTALQRSGTVFTDQQKEMVKRLVETGRTMEAQRFILAELAAQYGGVARREAQGLAGAQDTLRQSVQEVRIAFADQLDLGNRLAAGLNGLASTLDFIRDRMGALGAVLRTVLEIGLVVLVARLGPAVASIMAIGPATRVAVAGLTLMQAQFLAGAAASVIFTRAASAAAGVMVLLGGPAGVAIAAAVAMGLIVRRMREVRDPTDLAAKAGREYADAIARIRAEQGEEAATNWADERLREARAAVAAAEAAYALAQAQVQVSDPDAALITGSRVDEAVRNLNAARAALAGIRAEIDGVNDSQRDGARDLTSTASEAVSKLRERLALAQQELNIQRLGLQFGQQSVQVLTAQRDARLEALEATLRQLAGTEELSDAEEQLIRQTLEVQRNIENTNAAMRLLSSGAATLPALLQQAASAGFGLATALSAASASMDGVIAGARAGLATLNDQITATQTGTAVSVIALRRQAQEAEDAAAAAERMAIANGTVNVEAMEAARRLREQAEEARNLADSTDEANRRLGDLRDSMRSGASAAADALKAALELVREAIQRQTPRAERLRQEHQALADALALVRESLTPEEIDMVTAALQRQADLMGGTVSGGIREGARGYAESLKTMSEEIAEFTQNQFRAMEDTLVDFFMTGKAGFRDFANAAIRELLRILVRQWIIAPIANFLGFGGAPVGHVGHIVGQAAAVTRQLPRFHTGGIGSGEQMAVVRRGEAILPTSRLSDGTLGIRAEGMGGASITNVVNVKVEGGAAAGTSQTQQEELGRTISRQITVALQEEMSRFTQREMRPGGMLYKGSM